MEIIIAAANPWTLRCAERFRIARSDIKTHIVTEQSGLTPESVGAIRPAYIFFPHWSWRIPNEICANYTCVVFHPTDVPFGRGGTPIQNLIVLGYSESIISAIKATGEIDCGDVFLKRKLSLLGGGEEILLRMQSVIFDDMIPFILTNDILPEPQTGEPTAFKRRTPDMSELRPNMTVRQLFDAIRMLDIEGYPKAFLRYGGYTLTFSRPALKTDGIEADVKITGGFYD